MATPTIRDVAKHAGVGVGTVSRVINNNNAVRETTRNKVLATIKKLGYAPNEAARRLSGGKTMSIGVAVPHFTNPSVVERLQGIVSAIAPSAYDLLLFDIENKGQSDDLLGSIFKRNLVDGLIILSMMPSEEECNLIQDSNIPVVLVDVFHEEFTCVVVDNVRGGFLAVKHLVDLGHRKIAFLSDYMNEPFTRSVPDRFEGYLQGLAYGDIPYRKEYHVEGDIDRQTSRFLARQLLQLPDPPTAIFAYCDTQALGVLMAAEETGLRVPEQLSVVGYDDIEVAELLHLTTIRQHLFDSGVQGAHLLLEEIIPGKTQSEAIILPTEIIVRKTTAPPSTGNLM